jgi:transposase
MALRSMTVQRYEEIRRRLAEGRGLREIARALGCSRRTVREVRDGERRSPDAPKSIGDPLWMSQLDWPTIIHDLGLGHPLKFLWEEKAQSLTTYSNFWKQFYRKFPQYREATVTAREFTPGERVEVDYAGDPIEWIEIKSGEIRKAWVFVAGLGFSQLLFAWAAEDMKSRNWLGCHRRMFAYYGGVAHVTVPDCLKQGVLKCHLYDPDLNPAYAQLATDYSTAVVPARAKKPKDKAVVEGLVKILMRYLRFRYRRHRFTSLSEINHALGECIERINDRRHTRFGVSRRERFETLEKAALKPLPIGEVDCGDWKEAKLHADCYVSVEGDYYSAPHIHRHKKLRIKLGAVPEAPFSRGGNEDRHMRDPLFAWAFILLSVLGILQAVIEWLLWRRLASAEPTGVRRLLGTGVANRRSLGVVPVWRFLLRRQYEPVKDRSTVFLGDLLRIANAAFALALLGVFGTFAVRFIRLFFHP